LFEPNFEGFNSGWIPKSDGIGREYLKIDAGGSILPKYRYNTNRQHFVFKHGNRI
jgi:3-oxoacyl-[acyl-carrier-protein] synthase-3